MGGGGGHCRILPSNLVYEGDGSAAEAWFVRKLTLTDRLSGLAAAENRA